MPTRRLALLLMLVGSVLLLGSVLVFGLAPRTDLFVSGLFADDNGVFWMERWSAARVARQAFFLSTDGLWVVCVVAGMLAVAGWPSRLRQGPIRARAMAFIATAYVVGPGLLVNTALKNHWGRARPRNITDFGGDKIFSSALVPSDQCLRNCSFVSGETSALVCMAVALLLVIWPVSRPRQRQWAVVLMTSWAATGAILRIAFGGHFISDVIFATAMMLIATPALWLMFFGVEQPRPR